MKILGVITVAILCIQFATSTPKSSQVIEADAVVELIGKRTKRSINTAAFDFHEIDLKISAFGITHEIALKSQPKGSVISENFKMKSIYTGNNGNTIWEDVTPLKGEIAAIEQKMYVDVQTNSAVLVEHKEDGKGIKRMSINGIVNDAKIRTKRSADGSKGDGGHVMEFQNVTYIHQNPTDKNVKDYILIPENAMLKPRPEFRKGKILSALIELAYVIDYKTTVETFKGNRDKMVEYYAIMTNSINNKYALSEDPVIRCVMVGLYTIKSEQEQPFVNSASVGGGQYDLNKIQPAFALWAHSNKDKLGPHDVSPLMLGVEFNKVGLRGVSPVGGACNFDRRTTKGVDSVATPCSQDIGGIFGGAFTVTHEIAHNLGAPHDGERATPATPDTTACPWEDGFIMSYLGWGTTDHWKLSKCSRDTIRDYLSKVQCVFQTVASKNLTSKFQIGDKATGEDICKNEGVGWVPVVQSPDQTCRNTVCKLVVGDRTKTEITNHPPGNGAPCGNGGKCNNGYCLGQTSRETLSLDDICAKELKQSTAKWDDKIMLQEIKKQPNVRPTPAKCGPSVFCSYKTKSESGYGTSSIPVPDPGTICGNGEICDNGACIEDTDTDLLKCVKFTHQPSKELKVVSHPASKKGHAKIECVYGGMYSEFIECVWFNHICLLINPKQKTTLVDVCRSVMKEKHGVTVVKLPKRDEYCSKLKCKNENGKSFTSSENTPDGVVCGPLRVCKAGKCVLCSEGK